MSEKVRVSKIKEKKGKFLKRELSEKEQASALEEPMMLAAGTSEQVNGIQRKRNSSKGRNTQPRKRNKVIAAVESVHFEGEEKIPVLEDKVVARNTIHEAAKQIKDKEKETNQTKSQTEKKKSCSMDKDSPEDNEEKKFKAVKRDPQKQNKEENEQPVPRPAKYESLGEGPPSVPSTGKMYVGCHVSGAGGLWNAFTNAEECNAKSFGLFLRTQRQWAAKPLDDSTVTKWKKALKDLPPHLILPHGSYLMNLGCPVPETLIKSRAMLLEEIGRCEKLGIPHFNFHPGSTLGKISREECCKTIAESINNVAEQTKGVIFVLENMSCQGNTVGGDFHELRTIIENVKDKTRIGVCLDTCHAHAAGYDLGTESGFERFIEDFGKIVGWQFLRGLHINDSKGKSGSHLDRHENIGKGTIGKMGFSRIMNCKHFLDLPLILETPWVSNAGYSKEIKLLESLIANK
ncbi:probable endonuclease 4 [Macrobrachium nipponense]|uniref:probable endonuclease 4 n=1 Tax=Macrobrachium nipponense TaxID=159736 RepID=UPI0030C88AE2